MLSYREFQRSFGTEDAVFSVDNELTHEQGVNWGGDWGKAFAKREIKDLPAFRFPHEVESVTLAHDTYSSPGNIRRTWEGRIPTWGEVMKFTDEAIQESGDYHHTFLEALAETPNTKVRKNPVFKLILGS